MTVAGGSSKEFAVKIIGTARNDQAVRRKAVNEAEIWSTLLPRNVVTLFKTFSQENEICIVMEYIRGKTLFDEIVDETLFSERQACYIIRQVSRFT